MANAGFVVGRHQRNERGFGTDRCLKRGGVNCAVRVDGKAGDGESLAFFEEVECVEDRVVL